MSSFMPRALLAGLSASGIILLASCGAAKPIHYYGLEQPTVAASAAQPHPVTLMVGHFTAPNVYRDTRMVYRTGANQMDIYEGQRWSEPPALMVKQMLIGVLRSSGRYRSVHQTGSNAQGDYILRGSIDHFEEVDAGTLGARVAIDTDLFDPATGATIWTHHYEQSEAASGKTIQDVVAAINRDVERGVMEISASLDQYFTEHPTAAPQATKDLQ